MSCVAFIGWKHRAQARVTRAYYRQLALPSGTGRESLRECPNGAVGHSACSKRSAPANCEKQYTTGIFLKWTGLLEQ